MDYDNDQQNCQPNEVNSIGQRPGYRVKVWKFSAQRANHSPRGTIGPLGRYENHGVTGSPGRCPGLGEWLGLRPVDSYSQWNKTDLEITARSCRNC